MQSKDKPTIVISSLTSDMLKKLDEIKEETEVVVESPGRENKKRTQSMPVLIPRLNLPKQ
jgi:hypothetical protein